MPTTDKAIQALDLDRLLRLRLVVARVGELGLAGWWGTRSRKVAKSVSWVCPNKGAATSSARIHLHQGRSMLPVCRQMERLASTGWRSRSLAGPPS